MKKVLHDRKIFSSLVEEIEKETSVSAVLQRNRTKTVIEKASKSLEFFAKTYFPHIFSSDFCSLHKEIFSSLEEIILVRKSRKNYYVRAAPRGHGKSQIISFLLILWCIVFKYKRNILLVSDTMDQAKTFIQAIRAELEDNELLRQDFGNLTSETLWSQDKIITANRVQVYGRGAGQKLRGNKYGSIRPELVVLDDVENDEQVETEAQRKKLMNWFLKALIPVGNPNTDFVFIGTVLHYESLLEKLLTSPQFSMWNRKRYQAVTKFSDSPLWDDWEKMMADENDPDAGEHAFQFYKKHRKEMLKGAECLWSDSNPDYYLNLMELRFADSSAFQSEYQNEPIDPENADFLLDWFDFYHDLPEIVTVYGACDPSMARNDKSDRSAVIFAGKDKAGYLYILDVILGHFKPDKMTDLIIAGCFKYQSKLQAMIIETVQFQAMFRDEVAKRGLNAGIQIPIVEFSSRTEKELRLRGLIPKIRNKYIKFKRDQMSLINEFLRFPKGSDDGMDAVNMICETAFPDLSKKLVFDSLDSTAKALRNFTSRGFNANFYFR